jgi:hypothetical protein
MEELLLYCWVLGALVAPADEGDALLPTWTTAVSATSSDSSILDSQDKSIYTLVNLRNLQAGCMGTGLLIVWLQLD